MELDLEKVVTQIKQATNNKFQVFKNDIEQDELKDIDSYIIYKPFGRMRRMEKGDFRQDFYLAFVTTESVDFFEYSLNLIHEMQKIGLIFDESDHDMGKLKNTGIDAEIFMFDFHRNLKCVAGKWFKQNG